MKEAHNLSRGLKIFYLESLSTRCQQERSGFSRGFGDDPDASLVGELEVWACLILPR